MNWLDTKIRPSHNTEIWQIRSSVNCGKNTLELDVNHDENVYKMIQTSMFYCNPRIPPLSISSLSGHNMRDKLYHLFAITKQLLR